MKEIIKETMNKHEALRQSSLMFNPFWDAHIECSQKDGLRYRFSYINVPRKEEWLVGPDQVLMSSWYLRNKLWVKSEYELIFKDEAMEIIADALNRKYKSKVL